MARIKWFLPVLFAFGIPLAATADPVDIDGLLSVLRPQISGNRARDYTMRLWQYDKWSTLPMWQKTAKEAQTIMHERGFDEAVIVKTPADGVTQHGTWTNPIGWDCKQATLEVIEPEGLPDEFRYLCNYLDNPTSLNNYSCPTPPEGIVSELIMVENPTEEALREAGKRGAIILVSSNSRGPKKSLDRSGLRGIVSDEIESYNTDFITANQWLNGWSDMYGGWQMYASDSKNNFGFSISQKKGNYLRNLIRQGETVKVRAKIDSRYFTDDSLPYVVGSIKGTGGEDEDVIVFSHIYEWGANDDCTGASSGLEALGTLNDLIKAGVLPRPRRTIRMWLGFEMYGSMAYVVDNIDRMRNRTIASICCDTPAENWDASTTTVVVMMNFNACPSFTDALYPEIIGRFFERYEPDKLWKKVPFGSGLDNFFGEPMIGVPINAISLDNGGHLHHNSMDTIDKVDPRSLRVLCTINAAYLYYMANAGLEDIPFAARVTTDHVMDVILKKTSEMKALLADAGNSEQLGKALADGVKVIDYYTDLQVMALQRIERLVPENQKREAREILTPHYADVAEFGKLMVKQFTQAVQNNAKAGSIKIVKYDKKFGPWEKEAATIVPKRTKVGTLTLEGIPYEEWAEVKSSPRWWLATNWATASYFWCDGKRNLNDIKELLELEAGMPVHNTVYIPVEPTGDEFDLIKFYTFLEKYRLVEFVKGQ